MACASRKDGQELVPDAGWQETNAPTDLGSAMPRTLSHLCHSKQEQHVPGGITASCSKAGDREIDDSKAGAWSP